MEPRAEDAYHDGYEDGLTPLEPLDVTQCGSVDALLRAMSKTAFGGRRTGEAADVFEAMVRDQDCAVVLTLSGAMTIAKMGLLITELVERRLVHAIVSTGALVCHGFVEASGGVHFKVDPSKSDEHYYRHGYNRVYDTLELEKNLDDVVSILKAVVDPLPGGTVLCSSVLHDMLGAELVRRKLGRGILQACHTTGTPLFVPAFSDSELGIDLAVHNRRRRLDGRKALRFDPLIDLDRFTRWACAQEKLGIFTIGGGVPRNWAQEIGPYVEFLANEGLIEGRRVRRYTYALRICPEPAHWGGLSGCTYTEGVSWGKFEPVSSGGRHVEVHSDATIAWPLIVRAVLERLERDPAPEKSLPPVPPVADDA